MYVIEWMRLVLEYPLRGHNWVERSNISTSPFTTGTTYPWHYGTVCFRSWAVSLLLYNVFFPSFWYQFILVSSVCLYGRGPSSIALLTHTWTRPQDTYLHTREYEKYGDSECECRKWSGGLIEPRVPHLTRGNTKKYSWVLGFRGLLGFLVLLSWPEHAFLSTWLFIWQPVELFLSFRPHIESFNLKLWNGSLALGISSRFYNLPSFVMQYQGKRSCWAMKMLFIKLSNNFWACKNSGSMHKNGCNSQTVNSQLIDLLELKLKVCTTIISWLFI